MSEHLLEVRDLEVIYKTEEQTVRAVNGISFTLNRGEAIGIVGETGAGKTTSALAMMRLLPEPAGRVTNGSVLIDGKDLLTIPELEMRTVYRGERIAMIFQDPMTSLNPVLRVGEQIAEALTYHNNDNKSRADIDRRVDETLALVGIPPSRKNDYPHQFSGGMKQRVVIAMALACEPDLLIADEPTTALDVTIQAQVLAMINELREKLGTALVMITHDLGIIAQVCDKVAVMYAGKLIEQGTAEDIFTRSRPHHPYTDGLFASIPNLTEEADRLSPIEGLMPDPTHLPEGCAFSPRCPKCMDICRKVVPEYTAVRPAEPVLKAQPVLGTEPQSQSHVVACHLLSHNMEGGTQR